MANRTVVVEAGVGPIKVAMNGTEFHFPGVIDLAAMFGDLLAEQEDLREKIEALSVDQDEAVAALADLSECCKPLLALEGWFDSLIAIPKAEWDSADLIRLDATLDSIRKVKLAFEKALKGQ